MMLVFSPVSYISGNEQGAYMNQRSVRFRVWDDGIIGAMQALLV